MKQAIPTLAGAAAGALAWMLLLQRIPLQQQPLLPQLDLYGCIGCGASFALGLQTVVIGRFSIGGGRIGPARRTIYTGMKARLVGLGLIILSLLIAITMLTPEAR